jgi:predicted phosphodiesterase
VAAHTDSVYAADAVAGAYSLNRVYFMKITQKGKITLEYLENFPKTSKRSLAELLHKQNKLIFKDLEDARASIRYYTGAYGKQSKYKKVDHVTNFSRENPFGLPDSEAVPFEPYKLPTANNNILFLSDIHLPYHNIQALTLALDYGKKKDINTIFLNGDIMDCYKASFHEQDPKKRDLSYELQMAREFIDLLTKQFPKAKIFWKEGNHEARWKRFLRVKAPVVLGIEEFELPILLKLGEKGVTWIPNNQLVKAGKLNIIHGNEYKGGGGINVARTLWLRAGDNVIAGDKHKTQTGLKTNIDKKIVGSWSVGCLCELNPDYMPFNEWNCGFAHIEIYKNGEFAVHNKQVINAKIL